MLTVLYNCFTRNIFTVLGILFLITNNFDLCHSTFSETVPVYFPPLEAFKVRKLSQISQRPSADQFYLLYFCTGAAHARLAGSCGGRRAGFGCTGEDSHGANGRVDPAELQRFGQGSETVGSGLLSAGAASLFHQGTVLQAQGWKSCYFF